MNEPETFVFADDGTIPNSPLPLLVYRDAVPSDASAIETCFARHRWPPAWRDGVFPFHHFHSNAHEVLGVARGWVKVRFGGPDGQTVQVQAGDVAVLPAGLSHCNEGQSPDLLIVGAYPANGPGPDTHRGEPEEHGAVLRNVAATPCPDSDPVQGPEGALRRLWIR